MSVNRLSRRVPEDGMYIDMGGTEWHHVGGKLHREDGPAVIYANRVIEWYLDDVVYCFDSYCRELGLSEEDKMVLKLQWSEYDDHLSLIWNSYYESD